MANRSTVAAAGTAAATTRVAVTVGVTPIPNFIHDASLAFRDASAERLSSAIAADAEIERRFRHLVLR